MIFTKPITILMSICMPIWVVLCWNLIWFLATYICHLWTIFCTFCSSSTFPVTFAKIHGFRLGMTGLTFVSIMIGIIITLAIQEKVYLKHSHIWFTISNIPPFLHLTCSNLFLQNPPMQHYPSLHEQVPVCIYTGWDQLAFPASSLGLPWSSSNSYIIDSYSSYATFAITAKLLMQSEIDVMVLLFITNMFIIWDFNELVSSWPCSLSSLPCGGWICMMSKKASKAKWGSGSEDHE